MKLIGLATALLSAGLAASPAVAPYCEIFNKDLDKATKTGNTIRYQAGADCDGGELHCCYYVELTLQHLASGPTLRTTPNKIRYFAPVCDTAFVDSSITAPPGTTGNWLLSARIFACDGAGNLTNTQVGLTFQQVFTF